MRWLQYVYRGKSTVYARLVPRVSARAVETGRASHERLRLRPSSSELLASWSRTGGGVTLLWPDYRFYVMEPESTGAFLAGSESHTLLRLRYALRVSALTVNGVLSASNGARRRSTLHTEPHGATAFEATKEATRSPRSRARSTSRGASSGGCLCEDLRREHGPVETFHLALRSRIGPTSTGCSWSATARTTPTAGSPRDWPPGSGSPSTDRRRSQARPRGLRGSAAPDRSRPGTAVRRPDQPGRRRTTRRHRPRRTSIPSMHRRVGRAGLGAERRPGDRAGDDETTIEIAAG